MFDFDAGKLLLFAAVALVVVGPKELPHVLRLAGQTMTRLRRLQGEFRRAAGEFIATADLDSVDKELKTLGSEFEVTLAVNPATAMRGHLPSSSATKPEPEALRYASAEMEAYLSPPRDAALSDEVKVDP
jgi:sec-independent protein translocase protein TatB